MGKDHFNIDEFVIDDIFDEMKGLEEEVSKKKKKKKKHKDDSEKSGSTGGKMVIDISV